MLITILQTVSIAMHKWLHPHSPGHNFCVFTRIQHSFLTLGWRVTAVVLSIRSVVRAATESSAHFFAPMKA